MPGEVLDRRKSNQQETHNKMKVLLLTVVYVSLGVIMDKNEIITSPAFWSLYGSAFGALTTIIVYNEED